VARHDHPGIAKGTSVALPRPPFDDGDAMPAAHAPFPDAQADHARTEDDDVFHDLVESANHHQRIADHVHREVGIGAQQIAEVVDVCCVIMKARRAIGAFALGMARLSVTPTSGAVRTGRPAHQWADDAIENGDGLSWTPESEKGRWRTWCDRNDVSGGGGGIGNGDPVVRR
jgi:hypothetical protein